jgi:hypothetical protein
LTLKLARLYVKKASVVRQRYMDVSSSFMERFDEGGCHISESTGLGMHAVSQITKFPG